MLRCIVYTDGVPMYIISVSFISQGGTYTLSVLPFQVSRPAPGVWLAPAGTYD